VTGGTPAPRRLAIVTGTSSGIGAAVADALVRRHWDVVGIARRESALAGPRYRHLQLDLQDLPAVVDTVEREVAPALAGEPWSRVALVNNAATTGPLRPIETLDPGELLRVYAVNSAAPLWLMGFVLRHIHAATPLRIVNVSSGAAVQGFAGLAAYGTSKAALRMAGMVTAAELETPARGATARDVAILSYEPGVVDTAMQTHARSQRVEDFPWVGLFLDFKARRLIVPPDRPAAEIADFLERDGLPRFSERRLQLPGG
jgi:benzil reductase ((S)-benzoin forming)